MHGKIQDWPLTVDKIIDHAAATYRDREVVTRAVEGGIYRTHYSEIRTRAKRVSAALVEDGIEKGDRVATLAWNTWRHMETWYGGMGIGAVIHTINPRLHPSQIAWIINDAEDKVLFVDTTFLPIIEAIKDSIPTVKRVVVLTGPEHMPQTALTNAMSYELYIDGRRENTEWGNFDENTPCGLCYTSGTTGNPKGVTYTHRSNILHTLISMAPDLMGAGAGDVMLPIVPMFHANAWGLVFTCPAIGTKMVMPGAQMDGASIYELLETEKVTLSAAVPTVWLMLLQHLQANNLKLPHLRRVLIGGAAVPEKIVRIFEDDYEVEVVHAWGMTETSPIGTQGALAPELADAPREEQLAYKLKQGRPPFGVELCLKDDAGNVLPRDGKTSGRLMVRGLAVVGQYFKGVGGDILDDDNWFDTGDVATLDQNSTMQITDRAKDVIKSGGEWISSIDIENFAVTHPDVANAAAIGIYHPKWDERPLLVIQPAEGASPTAESILAALDGKIAKWWTPNAVEFVDAIPLGATGKIDKRALRETFKDYAFPNVESD